MNDPIIVNGAPEFVLQAKVRLAAPADPQSVQDRLMPSPDAVDARRVVARRRPRNPCALVG
jgi:hypothetical protein